MPSDDLSIEHVKMENSVANSEVLFPKPSLKLHECKQKHFKMLNHHGFRFANWVSYDFIVTEVGN